MMKSLSQGRMAGPELEAQSQTPKQQTYNQDLVETILLFGLILEPVVVRVHP